MNLRGTRARLLALHRELRGHWDATRAYWQDARAEDFERRHLAELEAQLDRALAAVDKLEELLTKVRHDCEPDSRSG
jgi:hypothetical protein